MPPHVPRKRLRESPPSSPRPGPSSKRTAKSKGKGGTKAVTAPPRKPTLFDDLDATASPGPSTRNRSIQEVDDTDDESSLSSLSDADFEDVPLTKRPKIETQPDEDDDDEDEDIEFEDVEAPPQTCVPDAPISGNLELTLIRDTRISLANAMGKKGPSKVERQIRIATHCVHVQLLLWHNAIRNSWLCDPEVQGLLLSHLPPRLWDEVERWKRNSGLEVPEATPEKKSKLDPKGKNNSKRPGKGKAAVDHKSRDWGEAAERLEKGVVDRSQGDPMFRLMKALSAWWKQRFRVTAPGLRKWGYMSLERLDRVTKAFSQEENNPEKFGERIQGLGEFRKCAQECTGSRDVGAQLFTALLRGLGLEARLVASLQPLGFGWNKLEEADPENESKSEWTSPTNQKKMPAPKAVAAVTKSTAAGSSGRSPRRASTRKTPQGKATDSELEIDDSDNDSVISEQPITPQKARSRTYDKDLEFPHYWSEVLSPVRNRYLPVDPIVKSVIGTNPDLIQSLEPRGGKADKAKQVIAYVVAYCSDGTAKDVTVRYLKRQSLPGRTKGNRLPIEKIPVYNRHGKVKRYELFDWFRSAAMKGYVRGDKDHPFTEVDDLEDSTDLKPTQAEKKEVKEGEETLQYYKTSKEFVLERHLKREEALLPGAKPVKTFKKGKGPDGQEEPVYLRKDVVQVKSAETWHKQGRAPIGGEQPLKRVPYRAATTNRRREIAEAEAATGEKVLQGLYSFDQTDWIIPPPIQNGMIPKNEYGNIDLFAAHMCPQGAVHVPYRGAMRVCKRLEIDYAEAVVDFEFGHRMAVPVIQGVVVAEEYHDKVMEELAKDEAEKSRKEDEKRRKAALGRWRKFLMGMRIVERIRQDYGHLDGVDDRVFKRGNGLGQTNEGAGAGGGFVDEGDDGGGGFLPEGYELEEEQEEEKEKAVPVRSAYFSRAVDHEDERSSSSPLLELEPGPELEPVKAAKGKGKAVISTKPKPKAAAQAKKIRGAAGGLRRRRRNAPSSSDEDDDDDEDEDEYMDSGED
ncbi:hypothetical protein B0H66DRAFT_475715 [Apodospora peruviana]|uniref:Uncharacterized protein n=1 Tax=Apodospora peruviana TaxID=516989 RepID=A0AAE0M5V5_9PEZI|nr:hypothetical protein B0H66DRAFT_475715 [Apodospora peruviana]